MQTTNKPVDNSIILAIYAHKDLLEACKRLSGLVQVLRGDNALQPSQAQDLIFATQAIAKAEGRG